MENKVSIDLRESRFLTLVSIVAAVAVVILHTNVCFWSFSSTESYWASANVIECVFYFSVPVFFMISGATNLDFYEKYSVTIFYKKRFLRTLIPYVAWSLLGVLFRVSLGDFNVQDISFSYLIRGLLNFNLIELYWFFGPLFCVYLSMPLFAAVQQTKKMGVYSLIIVLGVIFNSLLPFIVNVTDLDYPTKISIPVVAGYLIFVLIGYVLSRTHFKLRWRLLIYFLALTGLLMHIIGTYRLSMASGEIVDTFKGYYNIPSLLYSIGVFVFVKNLSYRIKSEKIWNILSVIAKYTFPLYLIQWFIIRLITHYTDIDIVSVWYRLGGFLIIIPISMAITFVLRKIPLLKFIVP